MGDIEAFIIKSYEALQDNPKKGRYFTVLKNTDNAPIVVHRKTNQFTYVIEGSGVGCFNGKERFLKRGDKIFIEAGTLHQFKAKEEGLTLFHIHIPDDGRENDREILEGDDYNRYI